MDIKNFINNLGFLPKENTIEIYQKKYNDYFIEVNFNDKLINYSDKITSENKTTQNFSQTENFVVLECVNRLLEKGYKPENIILEKTWASGHGTSGRLDICVTRDDGSEYMLIECKTFGKEFEKEFARMQKDGGQLFTYFKFSNKADLLMLYTSELRANEIVYKNEIVKIEDDYRTGDVKDFYQRWNQQTKDNGVFESWIIPYNFISKALTLNQLKPIRQEDSSTIFNKFLEILRHNVVSDKPNAFNKIFTLFLCKVYDEKSTAKNKELKFQWLEGIDDDVSFQIRLTDLYKKGMFEFLEKEVTDFSNDEFEQEYNFLDEQTKKKLLVKINKLRLEKNNEFAIKEVFDEKSFKENGKVVKEIVELLQNFRLRYNKRQQYLSDFFELLLTTGLKQESGQFFTPVPIAQFIIKSLPIDKIVTEKLEKGERNNLLPYVIDYAAGSGHFLTESMHEIQQLVDKKSADDYISDTAKKVRTWQDDHFNWATQYVYGIEKDYRLVKVGKVGCYLHGDGLANVILSDGLANFKNTKEYKSLLRKTDADFPKENKQFEILISNPPYAVSAFKNASRAYYGNEDFELYKYLTDNSSEIECLFIERTKQLLKDGGVAGIILPSSILSNSGIYAKSREMLLQYFDILGIAELGSNTFMATGTNTVTLFLRRRNNYISKNLKTSVQTFFTTLQDVTLNGLEKPVSKYVADVWEDITYKDYITLLQKAPNKNILAHDIFKEYKKKLKAKTEEELYTKILKIEEDKVFYYVLAKPQNIVLVKSGQKKEEKQFLGYEFSNRRGSEGIHPLQRNKSIEECTQLFDAETFDNPKKASTYIHKAFNGDFDFPIDDSLQKNITRQNLADLLTFDRVDFDKSISLSSKKKVKIESKWSSEILDNLANFQSGLWIGKKGRLEKVKTLRNTNFKFNNGKLSYDDIAEIDVQIDQLASRKLKYGDILLEKSGGSDTQAIGRVALFDKKDNDIFTYSNFCSRIRVKENADIDSIYLWIILNKFYKIGGTEALQNGVRLLNIDFTGYKKIKIPIPPKEIQQKIIKETQTLEIIEEKVLEKVNELKKEIENIIFSITAKLTKLDEVFNYNIKTKNPKNTPEKKFTYIDIQSVGKNNGLIDYTKKIVGKTAPSRARRIGEKGDFIISSVRPNLKGFAYINQDVSDCIFSTGFFIVTSKNENIILNKFGYYLFMHDPKILDQMISKMDKGQYPSINGKDFNTILIPLPPIKEQQKIVSEIENIEEKITALEKEIALIPNQKEAILKKYL